MGLLQGKLPMSSSIAVPLSFFSSRKLSFPLLSKKSSSVGGSKYRWLLLPLLLPLLLLLLLFMKYVYPQRMELLFPEIRTS